LDNNYIKTPEISERPEIKPYCNLIINTSYHHQAYKSEVAKPLKDEPNPQDGSDPGVYFYLVKEPLK
jgi:hypothetical protein